MVAATVIIPDRGTASGSTVRSTGPLAPMPKMRHSSASLRRLVDAPVAALDCSILEHEIDEQSVGLFLRLERRRDPGIAWRNLGRRDGPHTVHDNRPRLARENDLWAVVR